MTKEVRRLFREERRESSSTCGAQADTWHQGKYLALVADNSQPGLRVLCGLEVIIAWRGGPAMCVPITAST